jgi:CRP-like cAMP-binding protein
MDNNEIIARPQETVIMDVSIPPPTKLGNKSSIESAYYHLKKFHLLSSLSDEQLERVHQHSSTIKLKEGEPLFMQGSNVNYFYLILTGTIKLFRLSADGQEKVINIVSDNQTIAEALMFMDQPHYPVSASALSQSTVIGIDARDYKIMLRDSVDTCFLMLGDLSLRLRALIDEITTLSLQTGSCRVAAYLLENAPDDEDVFNLDIAKGVIAARLSIKPETFSRILKELHHRGIITTEGNEITIHDREALIAITDNKS